MVYSQDFLDSTLDNINSINTMCHQAGHSGPVVQVLFKGSGVHTVGGPTPFVELSTSVESNSVGIPESTTTKITLTGKIVRPQAANATGSGISHVLSGIQCLGKLFKPEEFGDFKVQCNSNGSASDLYTISGVKVVSVDVSKTSDNWVQTADYTVVLEGYKSAISGYSVKGLVDSWSIESLEDYTYSNFTINNITQKQEYHNPNLKPTQPSPNAPQPGGNQSGGGGGGISPNVSNATLNVVTVPQFKVSRTVSAIGIPSGTGCGASSNTGLMNYVYLSAKAWVDSRLNLSLSNSTNTSSGVISLTNSITYVVPTYHLATGYLYNHIRSSNFSIMEGKYEVIDNWIAMPTGIGFVEDYSIDMSTDEKYLHTISVKGEIRGLSLGGSFGGSGNTHHVTGNMINVPSITGYSGTLSHFVPDVMTSTSAAITLTPNKYENAVSGWINDIKPYLYRRACVAMSTADRTVGYVAPYSVGSTAQPPNNPVYAKHGLLNIIPVSTSESHNTRKGTISYSYDFNNKFTMISGVISENVNIEDTGPVDVIGEAFVLGRALGPVLQNLGTKTTAKKSVSIEVTVVPPSSLAGFFMQNSVCPLWTGGTIFTTITGILEALKPFGDRASSFIGASPVTRGAATNDTGQVFVSQDNQSWDPTNGKYVRSVAWNYQQCTNSRNWLNH